MAAEPAAVLQRRRQLLDRIRATTATTVARVWDGLSTYDESAQATFRRQARPPTVAGQGRAIDLTLASLAAVIGADELPNREAILEAIEPDFATPFHALGHALTERRPMQEAVLAGRAVASAMALDSVTHASRRAASAYDEYVVGWERVPSGGACAWCVEVAGQVYKSAESADFGHDRCSCDASPVLAR